MKSLFSLENKVALVTGASRGLGQAMAIALSSAGAKVICSSSTHNGCSDTVKKINKSGRCEQVAANLANRKEVKVLFEKAMAIYGEIDILVNNGGTVARYPVTDYPMEEWDRILEINLSSAFLLSQLCANHMTKKKSGKIINIASMLSYSGGINVSAYTASKHGIAGITKALANELACHNIQVNAIAPGYFKTDNTENLQNDQKRNAEILARIPSKRWGDPSDLKGTIVFLASAASNYVNGSIINVDGGWMSR